VFYSPGIRVAQEKARAAVLSVSHRKKAKFRTVTQMTSWECLTDKSPRW
jgi:hypothetical protein